MTIRASEVYSRPNGPKLPLARKFPGKRKYWALAGKMPGNPFWKEIDRKYN
jgi:hypothetical protein